MAIDLAALGLTLKRAQYRNHRTAEQALKERVGVTLVQWDALRAVARMPHASGHDLALATFQSDQAFGALAGRLVDRGLVTRRPGVGRRIEHALTEDGRAALEAGMHVTEEVLAELFAPLTEHEEGALADLLTKLLSDEPAPFPASGAGTVR